MKRCQKGTKLCRKGSVGGLLSLLRYLCVSLVIFTSSASVFAANTCVLQKKASLPEGFDGLDAVVEKVLQDRRAATAENIRTAYCRRPGYFKNEEIDQWLKEKEKTPNALMEAYQQLSLKKTLPPECKDARCAAKKEFGEIGDRLLFMLLRYGYNGSHLQDAHLVPFTPDELDDVLMALSDFPETVIPFEKNKPLAKFKPGFTRAAHGEDKENDQAAVTFADAKITLYEPWVGESRLYKQYVVIHEVGHRVSFKNDHIYDSKEWIQWSKESESVSPYGATSRIEDFAETFVAYRYDPKTLLALNKNKYNWIKNTVFDGVEFTDPDKCVNGYGQSVGDREKKLLEEETAFQNWYIEYQKTYQPSEKHISRVKSFCSSELVDYLARAGSHIESTSAFYECIARVHSHTTYINAVSDYSKQTKTDAPELLRARLRANKILSDQLLPSAQVTKAVEHYQKEIIDHLVSDASQVIAAMRPMSMVHCGNWAWEVVDEMKKLKTPKLEKDLWKSTTDYSQPSKGLVQVFTKVCNQYLPKKKYAQFPKLDQSMIRSALKP